METPAARSAPVAGGDRGTELDTAPKRFPLPGPGCSVAESPPWGRGGAELRGLAGGDLSKVLPRAPAIKLYIGLPFLPWLMMGAVAVVRVFIIQQLDLMPIIPRAEGRALSSKVKIIKK